MSCLNKLSKPAVFLMGIPIFRVSPSGWATISSPLFTMAILLTFTGIPQAEGPNSKRWYDGGAAQAAYEAYFTSTPPLWLCPPSIYRSLPLPIKRVLCFELPMYAYHGAASEVTSTPATHDVVQVQERSYVAPHLQESQP